MHRYIFLTAAIIICIGCKDANAVGSKKLKPKTQDTKKFEMYEMSEMAILMEQMYIYNQQLKSKIEKGEELGNFPNHFKEIHKSKMTDSSDKDNFFIDKSKVFLDAQEQIFKDPKNAKEHFNKAVQACISCHEVKCTGPIVRIKKLQLN